MGVSVRFHTAQVGLLGWSSALCFCVSLSLRFPSVAQARLRQFSCFVFLVFKRPSSPCVCRLHLILLNHDCRSSFQPFSCHFYIALSLLFSFFILLVLRDSHHHRHNHAAFSKTFLDSLHFHTSSMPSMSCSVSFNSVLLFLGSMTLVTLCPQVGGASQLGPVLELPAPPAVCDGHLLQHPQPHSEPHHDGRALVGVCSSGGVNANG